MINRMSRAFILSSSSVRLCCLEHSFDVDLAWSKDDQQSNINLCRIQVIHKLKLMSHRNLRHRF